MWSTYEEYKRRKRVIAEKVRILRQYDRVILCRRSRRKKTAKENTTLGGS
jgi:hypothetical protein